MSPSAPCQIRSLDEIVDAVLDAGAGVRMPDSNAVVSVGVVKAVRLWVAAEHDDVPCSLVEGALVFGSDDRWVRKQLGVQNERRRHERLHRRGIEVPSSCYLCGSDLGDLREVNLDHWYPRSLGGPDELWNLRLVHKACNSRKGNSVIPEAEAAYRAWVGSRRSCRRPIRVDPRFPHWLVAARR